MTTAPEPAWLRAARAKLGTREAPGLANSLTILGWARKLGTKVLGMAYNADSVPWCGLFVATCIADAGLSPAPVAVRAKAWATWGVPTRPRVGAVLCSRATAADTSPSTSARPTRTSRCWAATRATACRSCGSRRIG